MPTVCDSGLRFGRNSFLSDNRYSTLLVYSQFGKARTLRIVFRLKSQTICISAACNAHGSAEGQNGTQNASQSGVLCADGAPAQLLANRRSMEGALRVSLSHSSHTSTLYRFHICDGANAYCMLASCTLVAVLIDALHAVHCAYVDIALSRALDGGGWKR